VRHDGVKRMMVGFAGDGDKLVGEGRVSLNFTGRTRTSSAIDDRQPWGWLISAHDNNPRRET
jgi:hypothetical protein